MARPNIQKTFSLDGKVALVTGASRGIGWATARAMADAGARVVLNGRRAESLEARCRELHADGFAAEAAAFDVADAAAAEKGVKEVVARHGRLDVLVHNAGNVHRAPLVDFPLEEWRNLIDTHLTGGFVLAREAARHMVERGSGRIIITSSIIALLARPTIPAYVAAKGGLTALTRALAAELGPKGITCNAIAPGFIITEMTTELRRDQAFIDFVNRRTPLGRWGEPEEIAAAALFLASDAASYVNGHLLVVDGGVTASL